MEDNSDSNKTSAFESGNENFDWIYLQNFSKKMKKIYTQFPLKSWKNIIFNPDELQIRDGGLYYQGTVNKILRKDVFMGLDFHEEVHGAIDFNFRKVYKIDYGQLHKNNIYPDFFVYKIEAKNFFDLIDSRKYMMILHHKNNIPENAKFISILGEIKSSYNGCHSPSLQNEDYEKFLESANQLKNDEYIILMYIYDNSFQFFDRDYNNIPVEEIPIIYGYVPKLYYEDCYCKYNELIDLLKLNIEKIDLHDKTKFKKSRRELEKENIELAQKYQKVAQKYQKVAQVAQKYEEVAEENKRLHELLQSSKKNRKDSILCYILISLIGVIILAYLLKKFNLFSLF